MLMTQAPSSPPSKAPAPKPNDPTNVREPSNTRPPSDPTPDKTPRPAAAGDEDIQTEGQ